MIPGPRAGVIGWPVAHSLSPRLHRYWLEAAGIAGAYDLLPAPPEALATRLRGLAQEGYAGVNVTAPHKEAALLLVDRVTPLAARIGAINLIRIDPQGRLEGDNSDAGGFLAHLQASAPDFEPKGARALLLGAGGAARAIAIALLDAGIGQLILLNRTRARADSLAAALGDSRAKAGDWHERAALLGDAALLVNATTLGMAGQPALDIDLSALPAEGIVYDIVYKPLLTPLLAAAGMRGFRTVDGLGMLIHQAVPAFEAFYGQRPVVDAALRRHLLEALGETEAG